MTTFTVPCPHCRARVKVGTELVGKRVRCPKCQEVFAAPPPQAIQTAPQALPATTAPRQHSCPSCRKPLPPEANFCMSCGFNLRTGTRPNREIGKGKNKTPHSTAPADPHAWAPAESPTAAGESDIYGLVEQDNPPSTGASDVLTCPACGYDFPEHLDDCPRCAVKHDKTSPLHLTHHERQLLRKDYVREPHRASSILALAILSLFCCGLVFGSIAVSMAIKDLRTMHAGEMDPSGEAVTVIALVIGILSIVGTLGFLLLTIAK